MKRVVVTGMGVVTAAGQDVDEFRRALKAGRSGIKAVPATAGLPLESGALLSDFQVDDALAKRSALPPAQRQQARRLIHRAPLSLQATVVSALEAWQQAQLPASTLHPTQISLVVAGHNLNQGDSYALQQQYQATLDYLPPRYGLHFWDTDQVGTLSELLGIHGEGMLLGGASASGALGLIQGTRLIQWGVAELCVVVGALMALSPLEIQALRAIGALGGTTPGAAANACRPFDQARAGFIYGQGSGCLILENATSARQRGVPILAEVVGYGMNLDGNRLTDPNPAGEARAMQQALTTAQVNPSNIDYINTHGTASVLGDEAEITAIKALWGEAISTVWLNSTKSLTGHCLTAAGVIEAIATIIQMKDGFLHPNLNLNNPLDATCRFVGPQSQPATINLALSNSFGFGGINSAMLFRKV